MKPRSKTGFTLVELLVVIAIIGVLIALLLPAVQQAREAARRMQCKNHLKQFGIALHNYHDVHGSMPSGAMAHARGGWSWSTLLLPFIEQGNIHDQINFNQSPDDSSNANAIRSTIPIALCPSDLAPEINDDPSLANQATTSYLATAGCNVYIPSGCNGADEGAFFHNSERKFRDFTDGLSNSAVVGEVFWRIGSYSSGNTIRNTQHYYGGLITGKWFTFGDTCGTGTGTADSDYRRTYAVMRSGAVPINNYDPSGDTWWDTSHHGFGSHHPGGAHFMFGDGSTHFVSEHIEFYWPSPYYNAHLPSVTDGMNPGTYTATYHKLLSINDGNVVNLP